MENEFNKIDDLFRDSFSDYSETPPPAVWPALEKRLDERKKRRVFPLLRWYWLGALLAFVSLLGATLIVDMKPAAPAVAENAVLPLNTASEPRVNAPETKPLAIHESAEQTKRTAVRKSSEIKDGATPRNSNKSIDAGKRKHKLNKRDKEQEANVISVAATETPTSRNAPAVGTSVYSYDDFEEEAEKNNTARENNAVNTYADQAAGKHKIVVVEQTGRTPSSDAEEFPEVSTSAAAGNSKSVTPLTHVSASADRSPATANVPAKSGRAPKSRSLPQYQSGSVAKANVVKREVAGTQGKLAAGPSLNRRQSTAGGAQKNESPTRLHVVTTASVSGKNSKKEEGKLKNGGAQVAWAASTQNGAANKISTRNEKVGQEEGISGKAARQTHSAKAVTANAPVAKAEANAKPVTKTLVSASASRNGIQSVQSSLPKNINAQSTETVTRTNVNANTSRSSVSNSRIRKKEQEKSRVAESVASSVPKLAQMPQGSLVRTGGSKLPEFSKLPTTPSTGKDMEGIKTLPVAKLSVGNTSGSTKQEVGVKPEKTTSGESPEEKKSAVGEAAARPKAKETPLPIHQPAVAFASKGSVVAKPTVNVNAKVPPVIAATSKKRAVATNEKAVDLSAAEIAKAPIAANVKNEADSLALSQLQPKAEEQQPDSSIEGITPLMKFVFGIKGGLESGFSVKAGNKLVVAPYVRYNLSDKLGIVLQPSIKLGRVAARVMGSPMAYHNIHAGTGHYELDSQSLVYLAFTGDTLVRRDYTYTEKYDSIIKQNQVGGTYVEVELPILLQYQVSKRLSLLGGLNIVMGRRFSIMEKTKTYNDVTATGNPFTLSGLYQPEVLPVATGLNYTSSPISSYGGPTFPVNNSNLVRLGYMLGASYEWKKRWSMDATIQQCFVQKNMQSGYNVNSALSAPYFRFSIGYRLSK